MKKVLSRGHILTCQAVKGREHVLVIKGPTLLEGLRISPTRVLV